MKRLNRRIIDRISNIVIWPTSTLARSTMNDIEVSEVSNKVFSILYGVVNASIQDSIRNEIENQVFNILTYDISEELAKIRVSMPMITRIYDEL